jgi:predicted DNA-binding transcriptional regulator AlpA
MLQSGVRVMADNEERLVSKREARHITGISFAEMARRIEKGTYPAPIVDGPYRNSRRFFLWSELMAYVQAKKASRDGGSSK